MMDRNLILEPREPDSTKLADREHENISQVFLQLLFG